MDNKLDIQSDGMRILHSRENSQSSNTCEDLTLATKNEEIKETPEMIERSLQNFRDMLKKEKTLYSKTDEVYLLCFLRARKFDCERAFVLLKNYYSLRINYPTIYARGPPSNFLNAFRSRILIAHPKLDEYGRGILIVHFGKLDPVNIPYEDLLRMIEFLLALIMPIERVQKNGIVAVLNCKNFGFYQYKEIRLSYIKYCISVVQNSFPVRMKAFHVVNEKFYARVVYNIISPFLSHKIKSRVHFHGSNIKALHEYVDPRLLPEECGGSLTDTELSYFEDESLKHNDYFIEDAEYGFK